MRDPGDTTGDSKRRPDEPTEPPNQPKSMSARGGEERVEVRVPRTSKGRMGTTVGPGSYSGTPDMSDDSPRALTPPDKPTQQHSKFPSVELEGERREASSCNVGYTSAKMDASEASGSVEDAGEQPKKPQSTSELERKRSKRKDKENSPSRPGEEPEALAGQTAVPGNTHTYQESPMGDTSGGGGDMNTPSRDTRPGGCRGEQVESRVVEAHSDCHKVLDRAGIDGTHPRSDGNECVMSR